MRKLTLLISAIVLFSVSTFGQGASGGSGAAANGADKNFHFGLNITPGYYFLSASAPNAANGGSIGFGFGLNLEFYFSQNYAFCTGLELNSFGANFTNTTQYSAFKNVDSITAHNYKLQYLEIPLQLKFRTLPIGLMKYFGIVGIAPGIRVKATDSYTVTDGLGGAYTGYSESGVDASNQTSIIRLDYNIGAGVEYNIAGTTSLQGCLSYQGGFTNLNSSSGQGSIEAKAITLTIGVLF
jgi:hypothetical protein